MICVGKVPNEGGGDNWAPSGVIFSKKKIIPARGPHTAFLCDICRAKQTKTKRSKSNQSKAKQSKAKLIKAKQSNAKLIEAKQS